MREVRMNAGQWIVIILCILTGLWYVTGFYYNRRKSKTVAGWLYTGLSPYGDVKVSRLKGTAAWGAQFHVDCRKAPFRYFEVTFLLDPRENLPLWIYNRLLGKRDEIVLKANLSRVPPQELEAAYKGDHQFKNLVDGEQNRPYEWMSVPPWFVLAYRGRKDLDALDHLKDLLKKYDRGISRISIQRKDPHLLMRANLSALQAEPAEKFLGEIRDFVSSFRQ